MPEDSLINLGMKKATAAWNARGASASLVKMAKDSKAQAEQVKKDVKQQKAKIEKEKTKVESQTLKADANRVKTRMQQLDAAKALGNPEAISQAEANLKAALAQKKETETHLDYLEISQNWVGVSTTTFLAYQEQIADLERSDKSPAKLRAAKKKMAAALARDPGLSDQQRDSLLALLAVDTAPSVVSQKAICHSSAYAQELTEFAKSSTTFGVPSATPEQSYTDPFAVPAKEQH